MAETDIVETETPADQAPVETAPEVETPTPDPIAAAREATARAEGEAAALRAELARRDAAPAAKPAAPPEYTAANIEQLYQAGKLSDGDRVYWLGRIAARDEHKVTSERDRTAQRERDIRAEVNAYYARHPGLRDPNSPQFQRAIQEVNYLERFGEDPNALSTHLKAFRAVCGPLEGGMARRDDRRSVPVGGGVPAGGNPMGGQGRDPLRGIPANYIEVELRFGGPHALDTLAQKQKYADLYWSHPKRAGQRPA